ncbi:MAG: glycosyltransferase [Clostridiales bacterium]|nr:glycosyltransferase [Clostridiales bacterium]
MNKTKICVIAHFAFGKNLLNGQTVKAKIITEELENQLGENQVLKIDTHGGIKSLLKAPFQVLKALKKSENVIIMPAHNGLRVYAPLLNFFKKFYKPRKLHYVVIGGWLASFLKNKKGLTKTLKKFYGIYAETNTMKNDLEALGFKNVSVMPNCKKLDVIKEDELVKFDKEPYKLCTFSRVMKEKGIEDAINSVKAVNEKFSRVVFTLDIYGQIDGGQEEWFENLQKEFPEYVKYGGLVPFDKSVEVLKDYFALLFPTYYEGEGFAGTLIDAFSAGIPIIASDWKYNSEIVESGKTGLIYNLKESNALEGCLKWCLDNVTNWLDMKGNCLVEAQKYLPNVVVKEFLDQLE